jgi:uncharacterized protein (DUF2062 family)
MVLGRREPLQEPPGLVAQFVHKCSQALRRHGRRLVNLRASPHDIALGCAIGAFVSITPLLGVQTILAIAIALLFRASVPAAVAGTFVGNPLSWPFIWVSTYFMGLHIVGLDGVFDPAAVQRNIMLLWGALLERSPQLLDTTTALLWPLLWPMLAGSLPLGLLTAAVVYYISRHVVRVWRRRIAMRAPAPAE